MRRRDSEILSFQLNCFFICVKSDIVDDGLFEILVRAAKQESLHGTFHHLTEYLSSDWWRIVREPQKLRVYALHLNAEEIPELVGIFLGENYEFGDTESLKRLNSEMAKHR